MSNLGRTGELLFKQRMEQLGYLVEDVSGNPDYFYKDIDFIITSPKTGAIKTFECKFDSRINQTGNLYLELTNVHSKGGKGWFKFCEADFLAYGNAATKEFYILPMDKLRQRINSSSRARYAQCGADSTGLLVALKDILDICKMI